MIVSADVDDTQWDKSPGTTLYMAPEQLAGENHRVDRRTDTFALGLILSEILTGAQPFFARIQASFDKLPENKKHNRIKPMLAETMRQGPPDLVLTNRSIPRALAAICRKALAFDQADRYQTAGELAKEVNRWLADEPVKAYRGKEGRIEKAARWARRNRGKAAAIVASLVFTTFGVIVVASLLQIMAKQRFETQRQAALAAQRALLDEKTIASTKAEKRYADSKAALKLAMSRGAWNEAIRTIDGLENEIKDSKLSISPGELVDLQLDRLDALDGVSQSDEPRKLARSIEQELKSHPERFDSRRRGRLYLRMGDLFREDFQPGETSAFDLALKEKLTDSERNYVKSITEPDQIKAIALLDDSLRDDLFNLRAIIMFTTLKVLTGDARSGMERMNLARSKLPEVDVLRLYELGLNAILNKRMPDEADAVWIRGSYGDNEGQAMLEVLGFLAKSNDLLNPESLSLNSENILRLRNNLSKLRNAPAGSRLRIRLDTLSLNPPAALIPFGKAFENLLSEPHLMVNSGLVAKILLERNLLKPMREQLKVPFKKSEQRIADYREALKHYPIAEIAMFLMFEHQAKGDLDGMAEAFGMMGVMKNAFLERSGSRIYIISIMFEELRKRANERIARGQTPFGPDGLLTGRMRSSLRKLLEPMLSENRRFDEIEPIMVYQYASLIEEDELGTHILSRQMRIAQDNQIPAQIMAGPDVRNEFYLNMLKAKFDPEAMKEFLTNPKLRIRGDFWSALRIRIHRDYPEWATAIPSLNDMPENPFQPTSVDHPIPMHLELFETKRPIMRTP